MERSTQDRDLRFEKPSGLGPAAAPVADSGLARRNQPVDLSRANRQNAAAAIFPKASVFAFVVREPLGQQRLEPFATGLLGHLPNPPQRLLHLAVVPGLPPFATPSNGAQPQARQQSFGNRSAHRHPVRLPVSSFLSQRPSPATPSHPLQVSKRLRQQVLLLAFANTAYGARHGPNETSPPRGPRFTRGIAGTAANLRPLAVVV